MVQSTASAPIVFIIDDDEAVRDSLKFLLDSVGQKNKTFDHPHRFLDAYHESDSGCIVLDIRMPSMSGIELQNKLNSMHCILPIIFITGHGDVPMAVKAIKEGAMDFVQKPFRDQKLLDLINDAIKLDKKQRIELSEHKNILNRVKSLSEREYEVLNHIVAGKANKLIAADIGISQRTVEIHRSHIMKKMKTRSLAHLVRQILAIQSYLKSDAHSLDHTCHAL